MSGTPPADPVGGALDAILSNPALTTPAGFALAVVAFIAKQYFDARQERRLDTSSERESESGIVETTREALATARDQLAELRAQGRKDRATIRQQDQELRIMDAQLARLQRMYEAVLEGHNELRSQMGLTTVDRPTSQGESKLPERRHHPAPGRHREREGPGEDPRGDRGGRLRDPGGGAEPDAGRVWFGRNRGSADQDPIGA